MNTFKELIYQRPDFSAEADYIRQYKEEIEKASSAAELREVYLADEKRSQKMGLMYDIAYIRNTMDTRDAFYNEEMSALSKGYGELMAALKEAQEALMDSPYLEDLANEFGENWLQHQKMGQKLSNPAIMEDTIEESSLCQEYNRVISACQAEFRGETCNISTLSKYLGSTDREERQEAAAALSSLYEKAAPELDRIYDNMVKVRATIAQKLGFESYIPYIYARMGRYDYTPDDVKVFRKEVRDYIVPLCQRLYEEQAGRLGMDQITWADESLTDPEGNAMPIGGREQMVQWAQQMYHELSPETGEFFDFMVEHELFDLETRLGKQPGGYCAFLPGEKAPFIFSNFNGTSADVDVLTHEAGHAFEAYTASRIYPLSSQTWCTNEINETHSMSMEFLTYPWMEKFFGDKADQYRRRHLESALKAIPYMVCVDEFQHRVFEEKPDAEGRMRIWLELEHTYLPWRDYGDNTFFANGGYWMQKPHIFINPFYYVDYALAQMGAFQFYEKMEENREQAWADYLKLCRSGGSRGYFATLEYAGLKNPLKEGTVKEIARYLESILFG